MIDTGRVVRYVDVMRSWQTVFIELLHCLFWAFIVLALCTPAFG